MTRSMATVLAGDQVEQIRTDQNMQLRHCSLANVTNTYSWSTKLDVVMSR
jgi:hypothetical protein